MHSENKGMASLVNKMGIFQKGKILMVFGLILIVHSQVFDVVASLPSFPGADLTPKSSNRIGQKCAEKGPSQFPFFFITTMPTFL